MPTSRLEAVFAGLKARLDTIEGAGSITRMATHRFSVGELPAIVQIDGGEEPGDREPDQIDTRAYVAIVVRVATDDALGPELTRWRAAILQALAGDRTLGGTATAILYGGSEDPIAIEEDEDALPSAVQLLRFTIHRTESELDPFAA